MLEIHELSPSNFFCGTVCDIETIGTFNRSAPGYSLDRYRPLKQVIFGAITSKALDIFCCENTNEIKQLATRAKEYLIATEKPLFAFNTGFERAVWEVSCGFRVHHMEELQHRDDRWSFETKAEAVEGLGIPQYDDPFDDNGLLCAKAWQGQDFKSAIAHNRSCLLKERAILLARHLHPAPTA